MTTITPNQLHSLQAEAMRERGHGGLQEAVERECKQRGLEYHHHYDSRRSRAGWPDMVILLALDVIFVELKRQKTRPTISQFRWLNLLSSRRCRVYLWRPIHLLNGTIADVLNGARNIKNNGRWVLGHGVAGDKWSLPVKRGDQ